MFRPFIAVFIVTIALWWSSVSAYFHDRYRCTLSDASVEISLQTGEKSCMIYLDGLDQLITTNQSQIDDARQNQDMGDAEYRKSILTQLEHQKNKLEYTRQAVLLAMDDFEQELFLRVKRVVGYYLMRKETDLLTKQAQATKLLWRLLVMGNSAQYIFVRDQMDLWERELMFLERIQQAGDFATLIPPLKRWIELQETKG